MTDTNMILMSAAASAGVSAVMGKSTSRIVEEGIVGASSQYLYSSDPLGFNKFVPDLGDADLNDFTGLTLNAMAVQVAMNFANGRPMSARLVDAAYGPGVQYGLKLAGIKTPFSGSE